MENEKLESKLTEDITQADEHKSKSQVAAESAPPPHDSKIETPNQDASKGGIDRKQDESMTMIAEQAKCMAQQTASMAEQTQLMAEQTEWMKWQFWAAGVLGVLTLLVLAYQLVMLGDQLDMTADELRRSHRPWVAFGGNSEGEANPKVVSPLTFDDHGARVVVVFKLRNAGNSPAIGTVVNARIHTLEDYDWNKGQPADWSHPPECEPEALKRLSLAC